MSTIGVDISNYYIRGINVDSEINLTDSSTTISDANANSYTTNISLNPVVHIQENFYSENWDKQKILFDDVRIGGVSNVLKIKEFGVAEADLDPITNTMKNAGSLTLSVYTNDMVNLTENAEISTNLGTFTTLEPQNNVHPSVAHYNELKNSGLDVTTEITAFITNGPASADEAAFRLAMGYPASGGTAYQLAVVAHDAYLKTEVGKLANKYNSGVITLDTYNNIIGSYVNLSNLIESFESRNENEFKLSMGINISRKHILAYKPSSPSDLTEIYNHPIKIKNKNSYIVRIIDDYIQKTIPTGLSGTNYIYFPNISFKKSGKLSMEEDALLSSIYMHHGNTSWTVINYNVTATTSNSQIVNLSVSSSSGNITKITVVEHNNLEFNVGDTLIISKDQFGNNSSQADNDVRIILKSETINDDLLTNEHGVENILDSNVKFEIFRNERIDFPSDFKDWVTGDLSNLPDGNWSSVTTTTNNVGKGLVLSLNISGGNISNLSKVSAGGGYKVGDEIYFTIPTTNTQLTITIPNDSQY